MEKSTDELMKILNSKKSYNEFSRKRLGNYAFLLLPIILKFC